MKQFDAADPNPALIEDGALNFVVVGAGPTGVETAGALSDLYYNLLPDDYHQLATDKARIMIVEMGKDAMELIGWYVLVPLSVASLTSGLIMSLGTTWGLFRHYWVSVKFVITIVSLFILFMYTQTLEQLGELGRNVTLSIDGLRNPSPILHAGAAILALLVNTMLSIYKPRGLTAYGRRKQDESGKAQASGTPLYDLDASSSVGSAGTLATRKPRWIYVVGIHAIGLALLFLVLHLTGQGLPGQ
jgi:hypothetical protein